MTKVVEYFCKHCKKPRMEHRADTEECPNGRAHRTIGYTSYGPNVYEADLKKPTTAKVTI